MKYIDLDILLLDRWNLLFESLTKMKFLDRFEQKLVRIFAKILFLNSILRILRSIIFEFRNSKHSVFSLN